MPPKPKKCLGKEHHEKNVNLNETCKQNSNNKENICLRLRKRKTKYKKEDSDEEFEKMLSSFQKQDVNSKPLTFWEKKIKDLESQNDKKKKCGLYDFSGTDDSASVCKKKKKPIRKCGAQIKKQHAETNVIKLTKKAPKPKTTAKEKHIRPLLKEKVMSNNEREKQADEKFSFSTAMPSFGVTSTPAINKVNLVGASSFMFLSPVIREVDESCNMKNGECKLDSKMILNSENRTPKREKRLLGVNVRILRSKKGAR